ncbi:MAG: hypothetical protein ACR2QM_19920 [Longimicrobiales bacterium]
MLRRERAIRPTGQKEPAPREIELSRDQLWPMAIAIGLALVVVVNVVFIYIAVSEADEVVPSYLTEER